MIRMKKQGVSHLISPFSFIKSSHFEFMHEFKKIQCQRHKRFMLLYKWYFISFFYQNIKSMQVQISLQQQVPMAFRIKSQSHRSANKIIGHYKIGQLIGRGGFAKVYKGIELYTKTEVAVKIVKLDELSAKDIEHLKREIQIHRQLQHPNIVRIYEVMWMENKVFIFMELVKGKELFDCIRRQGQFSEQNAAKIFYQVIMAVKYLHDNGIAHRDIKTQNVIIDENYNAKLIDFGLAKTFDVSASVLLDTFCGSPSYTAPQLLEKKKYNGQRVDIWCLGVTLYVLLEASLPFDELDRKLRQRNIQFLNWHKPLYSSQQAKEIYQAIFTKERKRITIENLLDLRFFKKNSHVCKLDQKLVVNQLNFSVMKKVSKILNVDEREVEIAVRNKVLGEIFCLYYLSLNKKQEIEEQYRREAKSENKRKGEHSRLRNSTLQPLSQKKVKTRPVSPSTRQTMTPILPTIDDAKKRRLDPRLLSKIQNDFLIERYKTDTLDKLELVNDYNINKQFKFRNIFAKNIDVPNIKPKSKGDSSSSSNGEKIYHY